MQMQPVAMISGASRGIGSAIATEMFGAGWSLSLGARTAIASPSGRNVLTQRYDALAGDDERAWVAATIGQFGRIDALVLNAGVHSRKTLLEADDADFDALFGVNLKAPLRLVRAAWPHLVAARGKIVTIASLSGKRVKSPGSSFYALSKFAAMGLAHGLRQCGKEAGVRSTAICPGFVATEMAAGSGIAPETLTQPADVARVVRLVLELPANASISEIPINWTVEDSF